MDNKKNNIDELLEKVIDIHQKGKDLSDDDMRFILQNKEAKYYYKKLLNNKTAMMQKYASKSFDSDLEWNKINNRKQGKRNNNRFILGIVVGIAASLLLNFGYSFIINHNNQVSDNEVFAFHAKENNSDVILQISEKEIISVDTASCAEIFNSVGIYLSQSDTLQLVYNDINPAEQAEKHILSTPRGKDFKMTLSDGTVVWLNAESSIEYPSFFNGKERIVNLTGEAYFKVSKDAEHPLRIKTENFCARVLGTEINVRNYSADN